MSTPFQPKKNNATVWTVPTSNQKPVQASHSLREKKKMPWEEGLKRLDADKSKPQKKGPFFSEKKIKNKIPEAVYSNKWKIT